MAFTTNQTPYGTSTRRVVGSTGTTCVASGNGVLISVIPSINSGLVASGLAYVYDAVSGYAFPASGSANVPIFACVSGGALVGVPLVVNAAFYSGLQVQNLSGAGLEITVVYRKGI